MKRRVKKSRHGYKKKPKVIRLYDVLRPSENELQVDESSGTSIELHDPRMDERISIDELITKFYSIHLAGEQHDERLNPIAFKLVKNSTSAFSEEKYWIAVFYGNYHVAINAHGKKTFGPHQAQLFFRSFTTNKFHWIATLQLCVNFHSEKSMKEALMTAIENKEWFASTHDRKAVIIP